MMLLVTSDLHSDVLQTVSDLFQILCAIPP